jgi:iron-sulfur cluster repair protein YtfE (RIC family)
MEPQNPYDKDIAKIIGDLARAISELQKARQMGYCSDFKALIENAEHRIQIALDDIQYLQKKK